MRILTAFVLVCCFIWCVLMLPGCNKRPDGILSENEMVDLLTDLQMAEAYFNTKGPGSNIERNTLVEAVLKKHNVTHGQLDSTLVYYGRNLDDYSKLYQKVEKNLKAENNRLEESEAANDIWPYSHFTSIFPNQMSDGVTFSMPASGIEKGSALEWKMRLSSSYGGEGLLGVEYENGMTSYLKKNLSGGTSLKINIQTDTAMVAKRIFGSIRMPDLNYPVWADSISLIRTDLDSLNYNQIRQQHSIYKPRAGVNR